MNQFLNLMAEYMPEQPLCIWRNVSVFLLPSRKLIWIQPKVDLHQASQ
jgi:hypothetical protein